MRYTMEQLDAMDGHSFENAVADLLFHNGYRDVKVTQESGDYGIDILARRDKVTYAIQCKRYKGKVSVKAVQEAGIGADFYRRDAAAVITNSEFTKPAEKLAKTTGVRLWGRPFLNELINNYNDEYDNLDPTNALMLISEKRTYSQSIPKPLPVKKTASTQKKKQATITTGIAIAIIIIIVIIIIFF